MSYHLIHLVILLYSLTKVIVVFSSGDVCFLMAWWLLAHCYQVQCLQIYYLFLFFPSKHLWSQICALLMVPIIHSLSVSQFSSIVHSTIHSDFHLHFTIGSDIDTVRDAVLRSQYRYWAHVVLFHFWIFIQIHQSTIYFPISKDTWSNTWWYKRQKWA